MKNEGEDKKENLVLAGKTLYKIWASRHWMNGTTRLRYYVKINDRKIQKYNGSILRLGWQESLYKVFSNFLMY